jgi:hypothetical protein
MGEGPRRRQGNAVKTPNIDGILMHVTWHVGSRRLLLHRFTARSYCSKSKIGLHTHSPNRHRHEVKVYEFVIYKIIPPYKIEQRPRLYPSPRRPYRLLLHQIIGSIHYRTSSKIVETACSSAHMPICIPFLSLSSRVRACVCSSGTDNPASSFCTEILMLCACP